MIHHLPPIEAHRFFWDTSSNVARSFANQLEAYILDLRRRLGSEFPNYRLLLGEVKSEPICYPGSFDLRGMNFTQQVGLAHKYELPEALEHFEKPCTEYVFVNPPCLFCGERTGYFHDMVFGANYSYNICGGCRYGWPERDFRCKPTSTKDGWLYFSDWMAQTAIPPDSDLTKGERQSLIYRWNQGWDPRRPEIDEMAGAIRCRARMERRKSGRRR